MNISCFLMAAIFSVLLVPTVTVNAATINVGAAQNGLRYIILDGGIVPGDALNFHSFIYNYYKIKKPISLLVLNSPGGNLYESYKIIKDVLDYGINTVVYNNAQCASACFGIFASGRSRYSYPGSFIGVHRASVYGSDNSEARGSSIDMLKLYEELNIPDDIQLAMIRTPPQDIYWLTDIQKKEVSTLLPNEIEARKTVNNSKIKSPDVNVSKNDRKLARELNSQGISFIKDGKYSQAISVLEKSKSTYPTDAEVLGNLGYAYYMLGDYQNAKLNLTASLNISPRRGSTWNNLGLVLADIGDLSWATECFINYWNYSSNKKAATNQFFFWENQRPGTLIDKASKMARYRLGIISEVH